MTPSIDITISPTGQTTIHTRGFAGTSCRDASRFLEEALGLRGSEQFTAEFHESVREQPRQVERH